MEAHPAIAGGAESQQPSRMPSNPRRTDVIALVWRSLLHPGLLLATALVALAFVLAAFLLPQLPDQLRDEPAATARWLLTTATAHAAVGPLLRSLGLFDVLHSLLFRLALAMLSLIMALHLADSLGGALAYSRLKQRFRTPTPMNGEPVDLAANQAVYRRRFAAPARPADIQARAAETMAAHFFNVTQCDFEVTAESDDEHESPEQALPGESHEFRIFAVRNAVSFLLQPLLPLGLLAALAVIWLFLFVGWEIQSPTLAPGEVYRAPSRNLLIGYHVPGMSAQGQDAAEITIQLDRQTITATAASDFRLRTGASSIGGRPSMPGLLVRVTDGRTLLAKPGQSDRAASVGVILPSPGSEESLLLPDLSMGLRIVRRTDDPAAFIVELYQGAELRPQQRIDVASPIRAAVGPDTETVELEFLPMPGMDVTVRHMPGQWLLWVAVALSLAGLVGFVRPPAFALAQIGPWPNMRSVVVLQTSRRDDMEPIEAAVESAHATASPRARRGPEGSREPNADEKDEIRSA